MTDHAQLPLHLCQVFEEEYENLHGPLDAAGPAVAGPVVKQDWAFHEGHVSDHVAFVGALTNARDTWRRTQGKAAPTPAELGTENDLYAFLAFKYLPAEGAAVADPVGLLNDVLMGRGGVPEYASSAVYRRERFERLPMRADRRGDEVRGMMEVGWPEDGPENFDGARWLAKEEYRERYMRSDLARFRRLLLEEAFPDSLARAYDLRFNEVVRKVHALTTGRSALCFSGGGIRSGTFALGVIQSLAVRGLLDKFDYLSTVSGGGYIGGWLTAWIHRHAGGLAGVVGDLKGTTRRSKIEPEPHPLRYLREFSSFLTPRTGLLSADSWSFIVIYVRNLLLNWVVLIPLLASVLMIPRVVNSVILAAPAWRVLAGLALIGALTIFLVKPTRKTFRWMFGLALVAVAVIWLAQRGPSDNPADRTQHVHRIMGLLLAGATLLGGYVLAYMRLNRPSNRGAVCPGSFWDRHRGQDNFLWLCLLPLTVAAVLLIVFWAWFRQAAGVSNNLAPGQVSFWGVEMSELAGFLAYGFVLGLLGWLLYLVLAGLSWVLRGGSRAELGRKYSSSGGGSFMRGVAKNAIRELIVTLAASLVGAVLLYVAAVKVSLFYDPVVNAFREVRYKDATRAELLPYADWYSAELYTLLALPVYLFVFFLGVTLFVGLTSRRSEQSPYERRAARGWGSVRAAWDSLLRLPGGAWNWLLQKTYVEDEDREWLARASAWFFIVAGGWLYLGGLVMFGPLLVFVLGAWLAGIGGASGLASLLGGKSSGTPGGPKNGGKQSLLQTLGVNLIVVASFVFFSCIVIAISLLTGVFIVWLAKTFIPAPLAALLGWSGRNFEQFTRAYPFESREALFSSLHFPSWFYVLLLALGLQLAGQIFARLINLNKFSLHAGYRDRIIRAFLGASRLRGERRADPFTGFDPRDNLHMEELRPGLLSESDFRAPDNPASPEGLTLFVEYLRNPGAAPEPKRAAATYLRKRLAGLGGESSRYFQDPPEAIKFNPSFRAALFADLNHVLQDKAAPLYAADGAPFGALDEEWLDLQGQEKRGDYHVLLSRRLLERTFEDCFAPSKYPPPPYRLLHVVNMALNLVGGKRLAWQQRRAESFTATALHSGSLFVGYRRTRDYGGRNGITLGTAVAVSGAAANSNMGYFSPSPFVTFVLTFFNARLGWWLGNPGVHGTDTFFRSHPQKALSPIIDEAFGLTDDTNPYVLLSDGGHFENLGLYEMVLRRCRHIVVVDGSADPSGSYDDLGGAVRKIRIDLGIRIEFHGPFRILPRPESEEKGGGYYAVGHIHYEDVDGEGAQPPHRDPATGAQVTKGRTGLVVYIKPAIYGTEPRDIFNYAKGDPTFPHESTADQFFDEPQFESHRMLGFYILESLYTKAFPEDTTPRARTLKEFVNRL
jgi:hypothetical protein